MSDLVVLVEDAGADVMTARRMLGKLYPDVTLEHFADGEQLLEAVAERSPTSWWPRLFLFDLNLPGRSGIDLLRAIGDSPWAAIPKVVLSGSASAGEVQRCYDLGAAGYLTKPMGGEQLKRTWETIGRYWFEHAAPALRPDGYEWLADGEPPASGP